MIQDGGVRNLWEAAMSAQGERHTVEEILALPDGQRAELIDGVIYDMATPGRTHQRLVHYLDLSIGNFIKAHSGPCEVYPSPFGIFLFNDRYNFVEPDISVICDTSKLDERGCHGAPEWVVEIVAETSRTMDNVVKLQKYRDAGVREYWVIDPLLRTVKVYGFQPLSYGEYAFGQQVPSNTLEGLALDFADFASAAS